MALDDTWLDDLYVAPRRAGRGIGSALLDLAKALRPGGFGLWVFEMNGPARRFYERHGLVPVERTDGSGNEERAPDVRYAWRPDGAVSVPRATVLLT
jgi:ribosomal protein S18 acetylase RimI-like enzyme